jgi:uncharacterized protein (TIGR03032 family)
LNPRKGQEALWRRPDEVIGQAALRRDVPAALLQSHATEGFVQLLESKKITLLVTREYQHLFIALRSRRRRLETSYFPVPHPSGFAVDRKRNVLFLASTRNPNVIYEMRPVESSQRGTAVLAPVAARFFPGSLYLHDLAFIDGVLHGSSTGHNAILRFMGNGWKPVWWPRSIDSAQGPRFEKNYLQLNSIAAGADLQHSFFSASCDAVSHRRPGHRHFAVDRRGVIFSGRTREAIVRGLTRPHSARLHQRKVWVDNSGYGELGFAESGRFVAVAGLPGWTRGLCFHGTTAFVGVSRVLPRFANYAPGLKGRESLCGIYAIDTLTGEVIGRLLWPRGDQIFAIDWMDRDAAAGFPATARQGAGSRAVGNFFYGYSPMKGKAS